MGAFSVVIFLLSAFDCMFFLTCCLCRVYNPLDMRIAKLWFLCLVCQLYGNVSLVVNVPNDTFSTTVGSFTYGTLSGDLRGCLNYLNTVSATYNITFDL